MQRIRPILRWPGGKTRLLADILPLIRPHKLYAEAFGGGLAVFLAKPPSDTEVINDFNGDLVNLYRYAQFHLEPLLNEVQFTLTSRAAPSRENVLANLRALSARLDKVSVENLSYERQISFHAAPVKARRAA